MQVLGPWIRREYDKIPNFEFGLLSALIIFVIYQTKNYNQAKSRKHKIRLNGLSFERAFIVKKKKNEPIAAMRSLHKNVVIIFNLYNLFIARSLYYCLS